MKMKVSIKYFLLIVSVFSFFCTKAQNHDARFGIGVSSEIFSLSLNSDVEQLSTDVFASYSFNRDFQVMLISRSSKLMDMETKIFENSNAGLIGLGYFFKNDTSSNFSALAHMMYGNTFSKASSFNEHIFDAGVNFYFYKMFYLDTGLKFFHTEDASFTGLPDYNINWYWRLGFQLRFGGK